LAGDVAATAAEAFDDVFWPLYVRAFRLAYRILNDRTEAEDVASDALARTHLHWNRVGGLPYRDAWVLRVAGNLARDVVRRRRSWTAAERPSGWEDDALTRVALAAAVSSLPRRQRECVALRYLAGLDIDEIAACLGIKPASVRTHTHRAVVALRAQLNLEDDVDLDD
jgi:RNA polymerase sigma factor (sigma-70 family)